MASEKKLLQLVKDTFEDGEEVLCYVHGAFQATIKNKNTIRAGILVATNKKIRFCGKRFFFIYDDVIEYSDIYSIDLVEEKLGYNIFINGKKKSYSMKFIISTKVNDFVKILRESKGKIK